MQQRTQLHRIIAATVGLTLLAGACGSADGGTTAAPATPGTPGDERVTTTVPAGGGWLGGEPDWHGGDDGVALAESASADGESYAADAAAPTAETMDSSDDRLLSSTPVEPGGGIGGGAEPLPVDNTPLRAGSVDDNEDFEDFLGYLERIANLGIVTRDLDPTGRTIFNVVDSDGNPVAGALVTVDGVGGSANAAMSVPLRTTADGTVRFHPAFYGMSTAGFEVTVGDATLADVSAGQSYTIEAPASTLASPVPLDVLFLLDATGSMGDEIDRLKATIDTVAERVAALDPAPDVRFAMTLYRDEGDAFVTANYDFTGDVEEFRAALAEVVADGGGDYPEALDEGLADALAAPTWRDPAEAVQLIFVVADAPPQVGRQLETPYTDSVRTAIERGIKIFPIASSESDDQAEAVFRQMAQATGAPFVFLSNGAAGAATGASTDITSTDYEELALDELVVRLIAEELSDLAGDGQGGDVTIPTTIAPTTTNPDGQ